MLVGASIRAHWYHRRRRRGAPQRGDGHGPAEGEALCRPRFSAAHRRLRRRYRHGVRRRRDGPFPVHPGGGCVVAGAGLGPDRAAHRPSAGLAGAAGGRRLRRSAGAGGSAMGRSAEGCRTRFSPNRLHPAGRRVQYAPAHRRAGAAVQGRATSRRPCVPCW